MSSKLNNDFRPSAKTRHSVRLENLQIVFLILPHHIGLLWLLSGGMGWYVGCFYIIWSENYSEKLKIERFLESNHGNRSQHLAFLWKSSSNFKLLSSQKFFRYKSETLRIDESIIWLYCAQILCSSGLNCGRYSSVGDARFFCVTDPVQWQSFFMLPK